MPSKIPIQMTVKHEVSYTERNFAHEKNLKIHLLFQIFFLPLLYKDVK